MMIISNVLAVEPGDSMEAHVRRYIAFRFAGHAVVDLRGQDEIWTARLHSAEAGDAVVTIKADLIEDDLYLAFDILDMAA